MEAYLQSLGQNNDMENEWAHLKTTTPYKFDPARNYYHEALEMALKDNKYSINKMDENIYKELFQDRMFNMKKPMPCVCRQQAWLCECSRPYTSDEIKDKIYMEWLSYKYQNFKRNWKPKGDDGLNYMWITLNYATNMTINDVKLETARIVNLPALARSRITYCYELHTENGGHPHVHMLVELNYTGTVSMSTFLEKVYQKTSLKEKLLVDYKFSWAKDYTKRCNKRSVLLAYLAGDKVSEKMENVNRDKQWRMENNIEELYIKENN